MCVCSALTIIWLTGIPVLLLIDTYLRGRYEKTMFAIDWEDEWNRSFSIAVWPIYYISLTIYYTWKYVLNVFNNITNYCEKKGKQANDLDYQAEKHLLGRKDSDV